MDLSVEGGSMDLSVEGGSMDLSVEGGSMDLSVEGGSMDLSVERQHDYLYCITARYLAHPTAMLEVLP
jgi:hypothetical protein